MNKEYYGGIDETLYSFDCDNGLKVFMLPKDNYYKTYGIFVTKFGSCNAKFESNGITYDVIDGAAHFLEHKMFEKKEYDVMEVFARQSASSNAFTSFDKTAYLFSATANIEQNVETLLDFVQNLELSDESVEKEKPIIASEIAMYDDEVSWQSFFLSLQSMYHNNTVKIDIAGDKESIYTITKEDLFNYYNHFYHPSNMILFLCGNLDVESLEQTIKTNQNKKEFAKNDLVIIKEEEPKEIVKEIMVKQMSVSNTKYTYSFKVNEQIFTPLKQDLAMSLLMDILFATSTNFYQDLFNNQKITNSYSYSYTQDFENDYAFIQFSFTCDDDEYLTKYLDNYFTTDFIDNLNEADFAIVKAKYTGDFVRLFNNPEGIANSFISYYISQYNLFETLEEIKKITLNDLRELVKLFKMEYRTISMIQPNDK